MLIKLAFVIFVNTLFLLSSSVRAEINNRIVGNNEHNITKRIDNFFTMHPYEKRVVWQPVLRGKSRYEFSIPKDGFLTSKKYFDSSALYYLSRKIDNGLNLQPNKFKNIDAILSKNNSKLVFSQNFLSNINIGLVFQKKEKKSFGLALDKDLIISRNILSNFSVEQIKGENTVFNIKFGKLSNNENSEFYGNINHEFQSDILNVALGHTWFEIANQFDLTLGIQEQSKKVETELYATFGDESRQLQIGLKKINNDSKINMFFNINFDNILNTNKLGMNMVVTSKDNVFDLRNISLKSFRKKTLDKLWKRHIKYN